MSLARTCLLLTLALPGCADLMGGGDDEDEDEDEDEDDGGDAGGGGGLGGGAGDDDVFDEPMVALTYESGRLCLDPRTDTVEDAYDCPSGTILEGSPGSDGFTSFNTPYYGPDLCITVEDTYRSLDDLPDIADCGGEMSGWIDGSIDLSGHGMYLLTDTAGHWKILVHDNLCDGCDFDGYVALSWEAI